ncbi:MAG: hypothetical protein AMXMBFR83_02510 [Phycisphaerae bacterium]
MNVPASKDPSAPESIEAALPPETEGSNAARLLDEIRERVERLEGNLSLRERRLARVEKALREANGRLQLERAEFASRRDALEQDLSARLRQREQQLADAARALQDHQKRLGALLARERETLAQIERLTRERDRAAADLGQARRDLDEQRERAGALEAQLIELRGRSAPSSTPPGAQVIDPAWLAAWQRRVRPVQAWWRRLSLQQRTAAKAGAIAVPIMSLLIALTVFTRYPSTFAVTGFVACAGEDGAALADVAKGVSLAGVTLRARPSDGVVEVSGLFADPDQGVREVDVAARSLVERLSARGDQPSGAAERQARREVLLDRLAAMEENAGPMATRPADAPAARNPSSAQSRPMDTPTGSRELLSALEDLLARREVLTARLRQIDQRLAAKPSVMADVSEAQLQAALAADARLQADRDVLAGREQELSAALKQVIDQARIRLDDLSPRSGDADKAVAERLQSPQDQDVVEALTAIREALATFARSVDGLSKTWQEQRRALDAAGESADPAARQAAMETAARQFVEATGGASAAIQKALDAITQGGDEPTKRLSLRRDLLEKLQPALDSREALAVAVNRAVAAENLDLAGLLRNVTGLRAQVLQRKARIEDELRRRALADAQAEADRTAAALQRERAEALASAEALGEALARQATMAFRLLRDAGENRSGLLAALERERARAQVLSELRALDQADERASAAVARPIRAHRVPAAAVDVTSRTDRVGRALLGAATPPLLAVVLAAGFAVTGYGRRSRASIEDYARALREPAAPGTTASVRNGRAG